MWQLFKKKQNSDSNAVSNRTDRLARWIADKIIYARSYIVKCLEQADKRMTQRWRKVVFYLSVLAGNACILYILGTALRKPSVPFTLPLYERSEQRQGIRTDSMMNHISDSNTIFQQHKKSDNGKK